MLVLRQFYFELYSVGQFELCRACAGPWDEQETWNAVYRNFLFISQGAWNRQMFKYGSAPDLGLRFQSPPTAKGTPAELEENQPRLVAIGLTPTDAPPALVHRGSCLQVALWRHDEGDLASAVTPVMS